MEYVNLGYKTPKGREYGQQGFCRRVKLMTRCVENVFRILPPSNTVVPNDRDVLDCTSSLQAFIINAFGALDNLAWILVCERNITRLNGAPLPPAAVGLRRPEVLRGLSRNLQHALGEFEDWFEYLESFRHSLAHRIPLYIPPYAIDPRNETAYQEYEHQKTNALRRYDMDEHDRLEVEQMKLAFFRPVVAHSWVENAKGPVAFHPQLIADFKTVEEVGWTVLNELTSHFGSGGIKKVAKEQP